MDAGGKSKAKSAGNESKGKKRKHYIPHNKPVKKKGYPLRPGVQGFFITCDGGRERQAAREAINVIDSFYEELVHENDSEETSAKKSAEPANKKIKFTYSESSSSEEEEEEEEEEDDDDDDDGDDSSEEEDGDDEDVEEENREESKSSAGPENNADSKSLKNEVTDPQRNDEEKSGEQVAQVAPDVDRNGKGLEDQGKEVEEPPMKKQCLEKDSSKATVADEKEKSIDRLIEAELEELADKNKRHFVSLDTGCNGVVFVQMRKRGKEPGPREIVQRMMTTAASTRKHMSRFILRVLPVEVSCYASEEEISRAIKPLVTQYFPIETDTPQKFAVLYDVRANSGIDRMKIINSVAKSIPAPHKVDLNKPDKSIVVQIVKTVCLIGVVEKYKELGKYNLRQLTSSKP